VAMIASCAHRHLRYYHEIYDKLSGSCICKAAISPRGWKQLRIVDNFNMGQASFADLRQAASVRATLVPEPPGQPARRHRLLRCQHGNAVPHLWLAEGSRSEGAIFADAELCTGLMAARISLRTAYARAAHGSTFTQSNCITVGGNSNLIRTSAGGSIIWASPLGPIRSTSQGDHQERIRSDQFFRFTGAPLSDEHPSSLIRAACCKHLPRGY